ncbi:KH domain-containing protein HEN4 [Vitis vinifera]|uniref:KH domain-containing protein HEN4 n=1 Tax=Vitis vinifera TaxID=29760 RepID=A0A438HGS4_VITVI|nr:KH domain-containing protein HEN4 [Vitis vinifera]
MQLAIMQLLYITGTFPAVRKALLLVSSCLQDNPRADATNSAAAKPTGGMLHGNGMPGQLDSFPQRGYGSSLHGPDYHSRGYSSMPGPENIGANHRMVLEEEVVFKLLCHFEKVGSLIGKGGSIIRSLQSETGASIKIADAAPDSDERVVVISAREACTLTNSEQKHSPAQDAVIRVHCRIAEIGFEPGAAVVARLLVHSQQIGCLLGKGGIIISEMRRATGASIRIFAKEQVPKCGSQNDELVQGSETTGNWVNWLTHKIMHLLAAIALRHSPNLSKASPTSLMLSCNVVMFHKHALSLSLSLSLSHVHTRGSAGVHHVKISIMKFYIFEDSGFWQVIGSLQSVQDALFCITSRIRETIFPLKPSISNVNGPPYMSSFPEIPPPMFRPRHDPASPGHYSSPVGVPHGIDRSAVPGHPLDHQSSFSHGVDRIGPSNLDRAPYPYGGDRPGHGPPFDRPSSSPRMWTPQGVSGNLRGTDVGSGGLASRSGPPGSGSQAPNITATTVEVAVPQALLSHVYGENNSNLNQIRQISGARVVIQDPRTGSSEGVVVVSGTPDQTRAAQSLVQAFILSEQMTTT